MTGSSGYSPRSTNSVPGCRMGDRCNSKTKVMPCIRKIPAVLPRNCLPSPTPLDCERAALLSNLGNYRYQGIASFGMPYHKKFGRQHLTVGELSEFDA